MTYDPHQAQLAQFEARQSLEEARQEAWESFAKESVAEFEADVEAFDEQLMDRIIQDPAIYGGMVAFLHRLWTSRGHNKNAVADLIYLLDNQADKLAADIATRKLAALDEQGPELDYDF